MERSVGGSRAPLVSAAWLSSHIGEPGLVVLDCSWYLPQMGRDADAEYLSAHIPGALRFNLDEASDTNSDLPHMLPAPEGFATLAERLGIHPEDFVICYDGSGVNLSAARAWWMFRVFGHRNVAVLDGGFGAWARETRPVQRGAGRRPPTGYRGDGVDHALIRDRAAIERIVAGDAEAQVVDCRPGPRFSGEQDEPRSGLRRGHIPGSRNLPFSEFTDPATRLFWTPNQLRALFAERGLDLARPIVASCGSGVSACTLALAVEVIRAADPDGVGPAVAIYDGSWAEWGRN